MGKKKNLLPFFIVLLSLGSAFACQAGWDSYPIVLPNQDINAGITIQVPLIDFTDFNVSNDLNDIRIFDVNNSQELDRLCDGNSTVTDGNCFFILPHSFTQDDNFSRATTYALCDANILSGNPPDANASRTSVCGYELGQGCFVTTNDSLGDENSERSRFGDYSYKIDASESVVRTDGLGSRSDDLNYTTWFYDWDGQSTGVIMRLENSTPLIMCNVFVNNGAVKTGAATSFYSHSAATWYQVHISYEDGDSTCYYTIRDVDGNDLATSSEGTVEANSTIARVVSNVNAGENQVHFDNRFFSLPTLASSFVVDTTAPVIDLNVDFNNTAGFTADLNVGTISITCTDDYSATVHYYVTMNDINILDGNFANGSLQTADFNVSTGAHTFRTTCIDQAVNIARDVNIEYAYSKVFTLIDEETGHRFNLNDINGLVAYSPDNNYYHDFKTTGDTNGYFFSEEDETIRFELTYVYAASTDEIQRNYGLGAVDLNTIGVCVPPYPATFYTHFLLSSTQRAVTLTNPYADCYITADLTRYAYQTSFISQVSLINKQYNLSIWDGNQEIVLGLIDGTVESTVNLDALEYSLEEYTLDTFPNDIWVSQAYDNTLMFYYLNNYQNNTALTLTLYDGDAILWNYTNTSSPNSFTAYFDHTSIDINADILELVVTRTLNDGSTESFTKRFTVEGFLVVDSDAPLDPAMAIVIAFLVAIFSLTFTSYRFAMGWFGIIACLVGIAILTLAEPVWYIIFAQASLSIVILFIVLIYRGETAAMA